MVLENIFVGSVGWTGFDFHLWKIWPFFLRCLFATVVVTFPSYSTVQMSRAVNTLLGKEGLLEQQLQPKPPPPTQVWDECSATHCSLCNSSCPSCIRGGGSKLRLAFSNMVNNCCQDESLAVVYCTPVFEAPSVISFTTDDVVQMLLCASFVFTSWMKSLLLCLNFFNEWLLLRKLDLRSERN